MSNRTTDPSTEIPESTYEEIGRKMMEGFINTAGKWLVIGMCVVGGWSLIQNIFGWGTDQTDASGWKRSGMTLYTDYGTGVQYLSDGRSLTPRLNPNGTLVAGKGDSQ